VHASPTDETSNTTDDYAKSRLAGVRRAYAAFNEVRGSATPQEFQLALALLKLGAIVELDSQGDFEVVGSQRAPLEVNTRDTLTILSGGRRYRVSNEPRFAPLFSVRERAQRERASVVPTNLVLSDADRDAVDYAMMHAIELLGDK
jgi:hypothetical protein